MQNKINKIKHTGVYVLVVDEYLYKTGDIFGEWVFLPMDSPAISKYDDTYVIIKYDLSDITNQTQKNWIQKQIEQNKHNISRLNNILIAYMENENWNSQSPRKTDTYKFSEKGSLILRLPFLNHKSKKRRSKNMKIQRDGKEYTLTAEEVMEAHEEFVTSFMAAELENSYDIPHKQSKDLAKEAYDMYADSGNYSEYDCIERVAKDYQDRCKEPTVTITWSECNDFEDGEVIPLAEANKRFEFTR